MYLLNREHDRLSSNGHRGHDIFHTTTSGHFRFFRVINDTLHPIGTEGLVRFLAEKISTNTYTNIMAQYYPCYKAHEHPPLDRMITHDEYTKAVRAAEKAGLKRLD